MINQKHIVFDFDGTLCEYDGWKGHDVIGKPIMLWVKAAERWFDWGHVLKLSTTRLNPYVHSQLYAESDLVIAMSKTYIMDWLQDQGILTCFSEITGYKPYGDFYIDDRFPLFSKLTPEMVEGMYDLKPGGVK
jgi:hypothetical protein